MRRLKRGSKPLYNSSKHSQSGAAPGRAPAARAVSAHKTTTRSAAQPIARGRKRAVSLRSGCVLRGLRASTRDRCRATPWQAGLEREGSSRSAYICPAALRRRRRCGISPPQIDSAAPDAVNPLFATGGRRPHIGAQQLEQLRFARAVLADERPVLAGLEGQRDVSQHPFAAAPHAHLVQRHAQASSHPRRIRHWPPCSTTRPSRSSLIRCAAKVSFAHAWRSAATSSYTSDVNPSSVDAVPAAARRSRQCSTFASRASR